MATQLVTIIPDTWVDCPECNGRGDFYADSGPSGFTIECNECDGAGGYFAEDDA